MSKKIKNDIHLFIFSAVVVFMISVSLIGLINIIAINISPNNYSDEQLQVENTAETIKNTPPHDLLIVPASEVR